MKRLWRWLGRVYGYLAGDSLIDEYLKPTSFEDASEPDEPLLDTEGNAFTGQAKTAINTAILDANKAIFDDPELLAIGKKIIEYPPPREQSTRDWVTERLKKLTGGLTRHPADLTQYPTPPTEADLAARDYYGRSNIPRGLFSHGYSMDYLNALLRRADQRDLTLTAEELMSLRARGLA